MKRNHLIVLCCLLLGSYIHLHATTPAADMLGLRLSAKVKYEPINNLKLSASEEFRFGGYDLLDCSYTELGVSYDIFSFLEAGLSYTAIINFKGEEGVALHEMSYGIDFRHRGTFDLSFSWKAGQWKFSLRERVQATYRTENINNYQQPQTTWVLRSRLKAAYKSQRLPLAPYLYFEPRLLLNGATWSQEATMNEFSTAQFTGYKDVYFNRYRVSIGTDWQLSNRNSLDFYLIYDYLVDKEIDAYKEGGGMEGVLKSPITTINSHYIALGIAYQFSI